MSQTGPCFKKLTMEVLDRYQMSLGECWSQKLSHEIRHQGEMTLNMGNEGVGWEKDWKKNYMMGRKNSE